YKGILFISKQALSFFVLHIFILLGCKYYIEEYTEADFITANPLFIIMLSIAVFIACAAMIFLKRYSIDAFFKCTPVKLDLEIFKVTLIVISIVAILFGVNREISAVKSNQ